MAIDSTIAACSGIISGIDNRQMRFRHPYVLEIIEMIRCKFRRIMTFGAADPLLIDMLIVFPAVVAVVLRRSRLMAGRTLAIHID